MSAEQFLADARNCTNCGAAFPVFPPGHSGASGYAITPGPEGREVKICYDCADKAQRADLVGATRFTGYLSGDGERFTTWTGGELGKVVASRPCKLTRQSFTHDRRTYRSVRVVDVWGKVWFGRGSPGIVLTLHKAKG